MDLIYTNSSRVDQGVLLDYDLDLAFGADENNLECRVQAGSHCCESGSLLYMEGTEYGGIVDSIESDTDKKEVIYTGRTWHGILNSKVLQPDSGEAYLTVSGEANSVIASLLTRMGLEDLFEASSEDSGLTVSSYKMNRYISGYDGIMKMLGTIGGKLKMAFSGGKVVLSAVPMVDYTQDEEFDADQVSFRAKRNYKGVNHLICLGSGQLEERLVVHLYADTDGKISQTQTQFGLDEICSTFEYSTIETEEELIQEGMGQFESLKASDEINIDFDADSDAYDVGDIIGAVDNVTGIFITTKVAKKIVTIKNGEITISLTPETVRNGNSASGGGSSGGGVIPAVTQYYVTPQMFGAVGDGVADDTDAVQAALDNGGHIYFPAGRYKTTRLLTVSKSCRIEMFKPYPQTYKAEYPLTPEDNWMGARIDTYSPEGGMVIGDGVEVDGLYIKAFSGFSGVVLRFNNNIGKFTYPAMVRLKHIKIEIEPNSYDIIRPESMFDFIPDGSFNYILEDITIGRGGYCKYGFRIDTALTNKKWANNVTIRNLCIDIFAEYPLYVAGLSAEDGGLGSGYWLFDGLAIQAYTYGNHINLITLKNLGWTTFIAAHIWDLSEDCYTGKAISAENLSHISVIGCGGDFEELESYYTPWMKRPENLNITNLEMSVKDNADGTAHTLTLFDGVTEPKVVDIPKVQMTDEQIGNAVGTWMDANAEPKEVAGKNKFNYADDNCILGTFNITSNKLVTVAENPNIVDWVSDYIAVRSGDIVRNSKNSVIWVPAKIGVYNASYELLEIRRNFTSDDSKNGISITNEDAAFVRLEYNKSTYGAYEDRADKKICVTVNNADITYEDYYTELVGGIGSFMALQSPNGTKYTLAVDDDGNLYASPV